MAIKSQKDLLAGLMFVVVGAGFALGAREYSFGTGARMGPGYFPLLLGIILALLGSLLTLQSFGKRNEDEDIGAVAWRPLIFVIAANLVFGVLLGGLPSVGLPAMGLIIAVYGLTFVSMLAGKHFTLKSAALLGTILAAGSYFVFVRMLGLTFTVWPAFTGA